VILWSSGLRFRRTAFVSWTELWRHFNAGNGDSTSFWNTGNRLQDYTETVQETTVWTFTTLKPSTFICVCVYQWGIYFRKTSCCCIRVYETCTSSIFVLMWLIKHEHSSRYILEGVRIFYQLHMRVVSTCCEALLQFNDLLASSLYFSIYNSLSL
jgi:hypothetical protein